MNDRLRQAPVGVIETTTDGRIVDVDERAATVIGTDPGTLAETDVRESFPRSASGTLREAFDGASATAVGGTSVTPTSFEEYYPEIDRWLAVDVQVEGDGTVLVYVRDRTERREAERTVHRLERRFERVREIDSLVVTVLRRVLGASNRAEVAETVCERLGGTDLYRFAWVGDRDFPNDQLRLLASAGGTTDLPEKIESSLDPDAALPAQRAIETGETQLVETIAEEERLPRNVRRAAFGHGLQSCLAVPLAYQGTVYGVVSVYSGREDGFGEQERVALETLGTVAGFAIRAIRQEDLLVADTVTEATVEVQDETVPFVRAAREADCRLSLDGAVPRGDGSVVCYLGGIESSESEGGREREGESESEGGREREGGGGSFETTLTESEAVSDVRWIRRQQDPLVEVTVVGETPVTALAAWGATVRSAEYTPESARLVAETPPEGDVRRLVEAVDATVAETDLAARRERSQNPEPAEAFRDTLDDRLTDRQRTVLRTAYLSEYFASPRGSTSAEVAATLDIAGSTMLHHLRRAERKLVAAFFEMERESTRGRDDETRSQ